VFQAPAAQLLCLIDMALAENNARKKDNIKESSFPCYKPTYSQLEKSEWITTDREIFATNTHQKYFSTIKMKNSLISTANSEKMEKSTKTSGKAKDFFLANNNANRSEIATERRKGL
jgi:hypothetical protein